MIKDKLQELGFSEKEVEVYLALLEMGSAIASDIAKKTKLNRSTTYVILESLEKRGLISVTDRRGATLYNSTPPEQLIQYLEGMAKRYTSLAADTKKLLPQLKSSRRESAPTPRVQLFEGSEGVKTVYEDTLASLEEMRVYASFENSAQMPKAAASKRIPSKSNLNVETIFLNTSKDQARVSSSKEQGGRTFEINIYDEKVVFISTTENFALVVESGGLAGALRKALTASSQELKSLGRKSLGLAPSF